MIYELYAKINKRPKSQQDDQYMLQSILLKRFETKTIDSITSHDLLKLHKELKETPYMANRVRALLCKMFNLIVEPSGDDLYVQDVQTWYNEGQIYDVTQFIDTEKEDVKKGKILNQIDFRFEESDQILADEFNQSNKQVYGDLEFKLVDSLGAEVQDVDGETLDIEVVFENPIYERLFDLDNTSETSIQYCPYFNREQRVAICSETMLGAYLMLNLAVKKTLRDVRRADGWIAMKKMERNIVRLSNLKLLGRDNPRKWWQLF